MTLFEDFPQTSKVWIYQSDRKLSDQETDWILSVGKEFTSQWMSHGAPVRGELRVLFNRFVVVVAEDNGDIGGCSIDTSVGLIRQIQEELKADFFNRMLLAYMAGDQVETVHANDLDDSVQDGNLNASTKVFNNTVTDLEGLRNGWMIPLEKSWAWGRLSVKG